MIGLFRHYSHSLGSGDPGGTFTGTSGDDNIAGTNRDDMFDIRQGGDDTVRAKDGDDSIYADGAFTSSDHINGGAGMDTLVLSASYFDGVRFGPKTLVNVEYLELDGEYNYNFTFNHKTVADGSFLTIDGGITNQLTIDGSHVGLGRLTMLGGGGADVLTGGAGDDIVDGDGGADRLRGGAGSNMFEYLRTGDSTTANPDRILDFKSGDKIDLSKIDADPSKAGDQAFHFGSTHGHTGDVVVHYDAESGTTSVSAYTNSDSFAEMVITLVGNHADLTASDLVL